MYPSLDDAIFDVNESAVMFCRKIEALVCKALCGLSSIFLNVQAEHQPQRGTGHTTEHAAILMEP